MINEAVMQWCPCLRAFSRAYTRHFELTINMFDSCILTVSESHVCSGQQWTLYVFRDFAKLAITIADVDRLKILLKFSSLFAIRCYIVGAEFGKNPTLFLGVMKIYTGV